MADVVEQGERKGLSRRQMIKASARRRRCGVDGTRHHRFAGEPRGRGHPGCAHDGCSDDAIVFYVIGGSYYHRLQ